MIARGVNDLGKVLVCVGLMIVAVGLVLWLAGGRGWLDWLGRLPGDIRAGGENFRVYFPIVTCVIISVVLTLVLTVISWFSRK